MPFIQVPPDSTGKLVDTSVTLVTSQHRENIAIADPATAGGVAPVTSSGGLLVSVSSGTVTLSSNPTVVSASSGLVQTLTSGTGIIVSASSGFVQPIAMTTGGILSFNYISSSSGNSNNVNGTQGVFYGFYAFNTTQAMRFLKVYGTSSAPTIGSNSTTAPTFAPFGGGTLAAGAATVGLRELLLLGVGA